MWDKISHGKWARQKLKFLFTKLPLLERTWILLELQAVLLANIFLLTSAQATESVVCCLQADDNTVPLFPGLNQNFTECEKPADSLLELSILRRKYKTLTLWWLPGEHPSASQISRSSFTQNYTHSQLRERCEVFTRDDFIQIIITTAPLV